jgi:hypothetical protein
MSSKLATALTTLSVVTLAGCTASTPPPVATVAAPLADSPAWTTLVNDFVEDTFMAQPMFAVQSGRHEFDGKMPDLSFAGISIEIRRLNDARARVMKVQSETLSAAQAFERQYLLAELSNELFWLSKAEFPFRNPAWYVGQLDPEVYVAREYAPAATRLAGYIGYARAIPEIAAHIKANLRTPLPRTYVDYAVKAFGGYADFYANDVPQAFASIKDANARRTLAEVNPKAVKAMRELRDWFVAERKTANENFALGPELYQDMLRDTDSVDMPIADIKAAALADVERNTAELKAACVALAPKKSIAACVAQMNARKSPGGPVVSARTQLGLLREFVRQKDLVSIPSEAQAAVQAAPPYNRSNSAYIIIPGPYEKNLPSVYSIAPPDPSWTAKEQLDYVLSEAMLRNTSAHEVWPGHFLQYLHSYRSKSLIAKLFVGYDFAEGWAHYGEELMREAGLDNGSAEARIAQLADALWRSAITLVHRPAHRRYDGGAVGETIPRHFLYGCG